MPEASCSTARTHDPKRGWLRRNRLTAVGLAAAVALLLPFPGTANHPQPGPNSTTVTFDHDGDNEWWVEVLSKASTGDSVVAMEVRAESSSSFRGLQNKGSVDGWTKWGPETAFRIPPGDRVMFRAHVLDGPTGSVATVDSCFFTHPAGVEQCSSPPPPAWQVTPIGETGIASGDGDMAVSDVDNDGIRDVTTATRNGVYVLERNAGAWSSQRVGTLAGMAAVAAGDGDGDGRREIYAMSNANLVRYQHVNGVWVETILAALPDQFAEDMTLGDIDGRAGPELYVAMDTVTCNDTTQTCTSRGSIYHVVIVNGVAQVTKAAGDIIGGTASVWIGDGDNDGRSELYMGNWGRFGQYTYQLKSEGGAWQLTRITDSGEAGYLVVVGDADRDGKSEVYALTSFGKLGMISYDAAARSWNERTLSVLYAPGFPAEPNSLFLGDGDSDGRPELYIGTIAGEVYQVTLGSGGWTGTRIAHPMDAQRGTHGEATLLVVGDGDSDGRSEVYASISFGTGIPGDDGATRVYQVRKTGFDATFTGVRGNEWWVQANVNGNGQTVTHVDVRLNGGDWKPLAKQSWGGWAASYRIVQGTVVQLRATATGGATDLSDCYRWIPAPNTDATRVACLGGPAGFQATFSNVAGNEWWAEVVVKANEPVRVVFAYIGSCSTDPADMTHRAYWGKWVLGNTRIPPGTKVVFEAHGDTGSQRSGGYIWPDATPTSGCP